MINIRYWHNEFWIIKTSVEDYICYSYISGGINNVKRMPLDPEDPNDYYGPMILQTKHEDLVRKFNSEIDGAY